MEQTPLDEERQPTWKEPGVKDMLRAGLEKCDGIPAKFIDTFVAAFEALAEKEHVCIDPPFCATTIDVISTNGPLIKHAIAMKGEEVAITHAVVTAWDVSLRAHAARFERNKKHDALYEKLLAIRGTTREGVNQFMNGFVSINDHHGIPVTPADLDSFLKIDDRRIEEHIAQFGEYEVFKEMYADFFAHKWIQHNPGKLPPIHELN